MNRNTKKSFHLWENLRQAALAASLPWREIMIGAAMALGGALFSGASIFGTYPFALALLGSAEGAFPAVGALLGTLIGAIAQGDAIPAASSALLLWLARLSVGVWLNGGKIRTMWHDGARESIWLRAAFSAAAAMAGGAIATLLGSPLSLVRVVLRAICTPAATIAFCTLTNRQLARSGAREIGVQLALFCVVRALASAEGIPFSAGVIGAFALSMIAARGTLFSRRAAGVSDATRIMTGVLSGVVAGLAVDAGGAPIYAVAALVAGIVYPYSAAGGCAAGWACASALSLADGGLIALAAVMPELTVTAAILVPLMHFSLIPAPVKAKPIAESAGAAVMHAAVSEEQAGDAISRMRSLSAAFSSLSGTLSALSARLTRPPLPLLREICAKAFDERCATCENRILCRERECAQTDDTICRLALSLHREGHITAALIPPSLAARCHRMDETLAEIEREFACAARQAREGDHTDVFAEDFFSLSALLAEAADASTEAFAEDAETSARIAREMTAMEFFAGGVTVYGTRRRRILAQDLDLGRLRLCGDEIRDAFERMIDAPLGEPEYQIDGERVTMRLESVPRLTVTAGSFSRAAGECVTSARKSPPNGDIAHGFQTADGRYYMLICDGMGTGGEASVTAHLAAAFLEELLSGGAQMRVALTILNSCLRQRSMECSAGIDLMEIDLYSGEARFVKSGAAPSFVLREGRLFRLSSKTVPIGIMRALDAEMIEVALSPGDTIVMLSDGVSENFEDSAWLCDMLASPSVMSDAPETIAKRIVRAAASSPATRDDVTAAVVKV